MKQLRVDTVEMSRSRRGIADETIKEIRDLYAGGMIQKDLAAKFKIHKNTIRDICIRRTYQDVP